MPDLLITASTSESTLDSPPSNGEGVLEVVNRLLGYDIDEVRLMAQGYRESAQEALAIAESNLAASAETLPTEDQPD